jgi:hypothetical protein
VLYNRTDVDGRVIDGNKFPAVAFPIPITAVAATSGTNPTVFLPAVGRVPLKTIDYDDQFVARLRVQRDF